MKRSAPKISFHPMVWAAAAFAAGILIASQCSVGRSGAVLLGAFLAAALAFVFRGSRSTRPLILIACVLLGAFFLRAEQNSIRDDRIKRIYDEGRIASAEPVEVTGTLLGDVDPAPDGGFLEISVDAITYRGERMPASGTVRLFLPIGSDEAASDLRSLALGHGTRLNAAASLVREDSYLNPGVVPRKEVLDRQGIDATGGIKSPLLIEVIDAGAFYSPLAPFFRLRSELIEYFRGTFSPRTAGILIAAVTGNKNFLDRRTADSFREGGTFHILVISGLHMTFIGGLILWFVGRFSSDRRVQFAVTAAAVWIYTLCVGADPPAVRACIFITAILLGRALHRSSTLLNALGATTLIILMWRPSSVFDPSVQLTFVSVFAIVGIAVPLIAKLRSIGAWMPIAGEPFPPNVPRWLTTICETLYWQPVAWKLEGRRNTWSARLMKRPAAAAIRFARPREYIVPIVEGLIVSVIVQAAMLPLLVYYFHRMPAASIVMNLFAGVLMAGMSLSAIGAAVLSHLGETAAWPLVQLTETIRWVLLTASEAVASPVSGRIPIYAGAKPIYALYLVPVAAAARLLYIWDPFDLRVRVRKSRAIAAAAVCITTAALGSVIVFHPYSSPLPDRRLSIDLLDVGQGDSALVTFPNGETMLIDGGGRVNYNADKDEDTDMLEPDRARIGEMVVSEYLWERGLSRIDHIVASHADADHMQGLVDIAANFEIGNAYIAAVQGNSTDYGELLHILAARGLKLQTLAAGDRLEIGGVAVNVIYPGLAESGLSENDRSLVIALEYDGRKILFTGDIEREAERRLAASGALGAFDVVKVPHHGSRTSSTDQFVDSTRPRYAIIPVGRRSVFGHPHPEVSERWRNIGAEVRTTGENGMITVTVEYGEVTITTFSDPN